VADRKAVDEASTAVASPDSADSEAGSAQPDRPSPGVDAAGPTATFAGLLPLNLAVVTFWLTYWTVDIVSPALPVMQDGLGFSDTVAGLVFSAFFAGRLVANLPAALLVDRVGARWTGALGAGLLLGGSVGVAVASGAGLLLPARGLQGTGVSLLVAAALLSTLRAQPAGGAAMTTFNLAAGVGGTCGLLSGGYLAGEVGWRSIFWLSAALAAALIGGVLLAGRRGQWVRARQTGRPAAGHVQAAAVSIPRRDLSAALAANLLVYVNYSIFIVSLPLLADERFDATAGTIGALLLVINTIHLVAAIPVGRIVRRWGGERAIVAGFGVAALGMTTTLLAPGVFWLAGPLALYAVGQICANIAAGDRVLRLGGRGGRAIGMVRFSSDVGLVVGPVAVGALADVLGVASPFVVLSALTALFALVLWREAEVGRRRGGSL
jgi:MFS transporter, DHA1 family, multidrug resistance protein